MKGKNVPDERCICSTSESAGTVLLTPEVLHAWKVEGNIRMLKGAARGPAVMGPMNHGLHPRTMRSHGRD